MVGMLVRERTTGRTVLALVALISLVFSSMALVTAQPVRAASVPAVLALSEDCEQTALHKQIDWSGNDTDVLGNMHSNAGITVSGNNNTVTGTVTFDDDDCNFVESGSNNDGGIDSPTHAGSIADPAFAAPTEEDCDFVWTGSDDVDLLNEDVWLDTDTLQPGLYCHLGTGKLQQSGQHKDGTVSFFANGHIDLSNGSNADYTAFRADGVLTHSLANSVDAVTLAGSGTDAQNHTFYRGIIYAPLGEIETGGQFITIGCLVGETVKLNGSNHVIGNDCEGGPPPTPQLQIAKTNNTAGAVSPGTPVNFTLTVAVTNGPVTATVTDELPLGYDAPTAISDGGTASVTEPYTITWGPLSVANGDTFTYTAAVSADAEDGDTLVNVATITSTGTNCPPDAQQPADACDDDSTVTVTVPPPGEPIVEVTKSNDAGGPVAPGDPVNFTITVDVTDGPATDAIITDFLPDGYDAPTAISDGGSATVTEPYEITWGPMTVNDGDTFTYTAAVSADVADGAELENNVFITSPGTNCPPLVLDLAGGVSTNGAPAGDDPCHDDSTVVVEVPEDPNLLILKENDADGPVSPGDDVGFTITVHVANGPAEDALIVDTVPEGFEDPTGFDPAGAVWSDTERTITWGPLTVNDGDEFTYSAQVSDDVEDGDELRNVVVITSPGTNCPPEDEVVLFRTQGVEGDDPCDDDSTVTVDEPPLVPSLLIDKVADATTITISGPASAPVATPSIVTWTLTYTLANGPVDDAVITDEIPAGFEFLDATGGGTESGGVVTWELGTITTGGSVSFRTTVDAETISRVAPTLNVAVIDSADTDPDEGEDAVTVVVDAPPLGGNPTPSPSLPDTAFGFTINGQPISVPLEAMVLVLIGSLGALGAANVRARRMRR